MLEFRCQRAWGYGSSPDGESSMGGHCQFPVLICQFFEGASPRFLLEEFPLWNYVYWLVTVPPSPLPLRIIGLGAVFGLGL